MLELKSANKIPFIKINAFVTSLKNVGHAKCIIMYTAFCKNILWRSQPFTVMWIIRQTDFRNAILYSLRYVSSTYTIISTNENIWKMRPMNYSENNFMVDKILVTGIVVNTKCGECLHWGNELQNRLFYHSRKTEIFPSPQCRVVGFAPTR